MAEKTKSVGAPGPIVTVPDQFFWLADQLAKRAIVPVEIPGSKKPFVLVPTTGVDLRNMEQHLSAPLQIDETISFLDLESFVEYVNRFKNAMVSVIFIDTVNPQVTAVIDYHGEFAPSWCKHKAIYAFPHTKEWLDWFGNNNKAKNQNEMGLFIEDHMEQITDPPAAKLLQTVTRMQEIRQVMFGQAQNLQNGMVEFQYVEKEGAGPSGKFELPESIDLGMAPFRDGEPYALTARMRYRCDKEKGLVLWFELVRPDLVLDSAVKDVRAKVVDQTQLPVYAASWR